MIFLIMVFSVEFLNKKENMNKDKTYIFHSDSGHGWLAVKRNELTELNIGEKISHYSYQKGDTVYLEEDQDATTFIIEFEKMFGCKPLFKESYIDGYSPIRSYNRYEF